MTRAYDPALFVGRQDVLQSLGKRLLGFSADEKRERCIVVEGPCNRGKTWLLNNFKGNLSEYYAEPLVVLHLSRSNFLITHDRQAHFRSFLQQPWDVAQQLL